MGLLNVQGLTKQKLMEIESLMKKDIEIFCLTETQQKVDKTRVSKGLIKIESMRKENDKKGGGLMILYRNSERNNLQKMDAKHDDILLVKGNINNKNIVIMLVYFTAGNKRDDNDRNKVIREKCEKIIREAKDSAFMVLGDFNGHIGFLGYQKIDKKGEMIIEWMNDHNLTLLNAKEETEGVYTWERNNQKSVIDYVLVNEKMEEWFEDMIIDEGKEAIDFSDHNLIRITFKIGNNCSSNYRKARWEETEYIATDDKAMKRFIRGMEERLVNNPVQRMEELDIIINVEKEESLVKTYRRKINDEDEIEEKPWVNDEIRQGVRERQSLNRRKRNVARQEDRLRLERLYDAKKKEVMALVKEAITSYEIKLAEEIRENRNKIWPNIEKLINPNKKRKEIIKLHDEQGNELNEEEAKIELLNFWSGVYQRHANEIGEVWNAERRQEYERALTETREEMEINEQIIPYHLREHMDMVVRIDNIIRPMKEPVIDEERIKKCLKKLRNKKAAGPDGIKPEIYKAFLNSKICLETLVKCVKNELIGIDKPGGWKKSRTKMIEKKKKPTVKDLRPIALTNVSYKIYMMIMKEELENHLLNNNENKETQAGFTSESRLEDNLFLLQYCVEESYKNKKPLIVVSIDFKKAFDSVKRETIIEVMKDYKVHPRLIEGIANIYVGDRTIIDLGGGLEQEVEVTSGIRQGCTGSATIFKMLTYKIMERIEKDGDGFKDEDFKISSLFFADDALVIAESIEGARRNIKMIIEEGKRYGLDINAEKSNILIYNLNEKPENIEGIKTVEEINYLGITVENKRDIFRKQKKEMIEKAQRLANLTFSVIGKSCNKLLIGKTFWKNIVLPSVLHGINVVNLNVSEIKKLQIIENGVYRKILGAYKGTAIAALKGEVGASDMKTRVIKGRLLYTKYILNGKKEILKRVFEKSIDNKSKWWRINKKYMEEIKLRLGEIENRKKEDLEERIRKWDTEKWKRELENRDSLSMYRTWKKQIKEEMVYDNRYSSVLLFKAKTGTLPLNEINRHLNGDIKCTICDSEKEDLEHFLLICPEFSEIRTEIRHLQQPYEEDKSKIIGKFLFEESEIEKKKEVLQKLWRKRQIRIKEINQ